MGSTRDRCSTMQQDAARYIAWIDLSIGLSTGATKTIAETENHRLREVLPAIRHPPVLPSSDSSDDGFLRPNSPCRLEGFALSGTWRANLAVSTESGEVQYGSRSESASPCLSASDDFCPKRQNHHALWYGSRSESASPERDLRHFRAAVK